MSTFCCRCFFAAMASGTHAAIGACNCTAYCFQAICNPLENNPSRLYSGIHGWNQYFMSNLRSMLNVRYNCQEEVMLLETPALVWLMLPLPGSTTGQVD